METEAASDSFPMAFIAPALTGHLLAGLIDEHLAALWRGEEAADDAFFRWFASCWRPEPVAEPNVAPAARSVLAAGGLGIHWFELRDAIVGVIPGRHEGHYRVSPDSPPPNDSMRPRESQPPMRRARGAPIPPSETS